MRPEWALGASCVSWLYREGWDVVGGLLAEALRRQGRAMGRELTRTFAVASNNRPMLRLVARRLDRHVISRMAMSRATKALRPAATES